MTTDIIKELETGLKSFDKMPKDKLKQVLQKLNISSFKDLLKNFRKEFHNTPEKYLTIDGIGDLHIQWFYNRYAALRMLKNLPIFESAYKLLTERGNYSRKNAFGEMHGDGYLWIEKHDKIKVIVEEWQSFRHIHISDRYHYHIRSLQYEFNYPGYRKNELKDISIDKFRQQGFTPYCPSDYNIKRFGAFTYGDARDEGYILSMDFLCKGMEKVEYADSRTISAINSLEYWKIYLEDPAQLE